MTSKGLMKMHLAVNKDFRVLQKAMFIVYILPYCKPAGRARIEQWGKKSDILMLLAFIRSSQSSLSF